jgi:hypothetical protein
MTFRTVPMANGLKDALRPWLNDHHPGGPYPLSAKDGRPMARQALTKAFRAAVKNSPWQMVQGYHVLRHSFASNCALKGVDQRIIDAWMGHQTEANVRGESGASRERGADCTRHPGGATVPKFVPPTAPEVVPGGEVSGHRRTLAGALPEAAPATRAKAQGSRDRGKGKVNPAAKGGATVEEAVERPKVFGGASGPPPIRR